MARYSGATWRAGRESDMWIDKETNERTSMQAHREANKKGSQAGTFIVTLLSFIPPGLRAAKWVYYFLCFLCFSPGTAPRTRRLSVRDQRRECWLQVEEILVILLDSRERRFGQAGRVLQFWLLVVEMDAAALRAKPVLRGFTHEATM